MTQFNEEDLHIPSQRAANEALSGLRYKELLDKHKMTQFNEELVEKVANEIDETLGICGLSVEEMPFSLIEANDYVNWVREALAKATISVIAPHYEKQIAEVKREALINEMREKVKYEGLFSTQQKIERLEKQIAELKEQTEWKDISTAPKNQAILLYNGNIEIGIWFDIDKWRKEIADRHKNNPEWLKSYLKGIENHKSRWVTVPRHPEIIKPTHFMYLPKPPTQEEE